MVKIEINIETLWPLCPVMRPSFKYKITFLVFSYISTDAPYTQRFFARSVIRAQWHRLIFRYKSQCSHNLCSCSWHRTQAWSAIDIELNLFNRPPTRIWLRLGGVWNFNSLAQGQTFFYLSLLCRHFALFLSYGWSFISIAHKCPDIFLAIATIAFCRIPPQLSQIR